jgi:hypothetical protein
MSKLILLFICISHQVLFFQDICILVCLSDVRRYRCHDGVSLPFKVLPVINEMGRTRLEVNVQARMEL